MKKKSLRDLIDPSYCLIDDYTGGDEAFKPELLWYDEDKNEYWIERDKIKYKDPDVDSDRLYNYWKAYIENNKFPNGSYGKVEIIQDKRKQKILNVSIEDFCIELTADYIGPSKNAYMRQYGIKELGNLLKKTRTFAGNIIWPCRKIGKTSTINQYKGCYLHERMDIVLMELQNYCNKGFCREVLMKNFNNALNKKWFECFLSFDKFVEYFCLGDFVNEYLSDPEQRYKPYKEYLGSIENVICKREKRIISKLGSESDRG